MAWNRKERARAFTKIFLSDNIIFLITSAKDNTTQLRRREQEACQAKSPGFRGFAEGFGESLSRDSTPDQKVYAARRRSEDASGLFKVAPVYEDEIAEKIVVELMSHLLLHQLQRLERRHRFRIGAVGGEGVKNIGDRDKLRIDGDLGSRELVGITFPVHILMVAAHRQTDALVDIGIVLDHLVAPVRVLDHHRPLFFVELRGLIDDRGVHLRLAD